MAFSASLVTGNTFANGDSATSTKLNNQVNLATFTTSTPNTMIGFDAASAPTDVAITYSPKINTSDFTTTSGTPATVTGLTFNVVSGKTYVFRAFLSCTQTADGWTAGVYGTATATSFYCRNTMLTGAGLNKIQTGRTTSYANVGITQTNANTGIPGFITIDGSIVINAGGTLNVIFAVGASSGTAVVEAGSTFQIWLQ